MLIYIEYISRRPGVPLDLFHKAAGHSQESWAASYGADQLLLTLGRTWRIGPEPEYLHIWYSIAAGLERLDAWEAVFTSGAADTIEEPFRSVARIDAAGCYEPLLEPVAGAGGPYYAEYFNPAPGAARDQVRAFFERRRSQHGALTLHLLAERIGLLGPEPRGIAIWGLPSYGALAGIARDLDETGAASHHPVHAVSGALYADFGREIL